MSGEHTSKPAHGTEDERIEQMFREATVRRYDHGGGRVFYEGPNGQRQLLIDLYGTGDESGAIREYVLKKLGISGDFDG